jgi:hypothetical protein
MKIQRRVKEKRKKYLLKLLKEGQGASMDKKVPFEQSFPSN